MSHVKHETVCITSWKKETLHELRGRLIGIGAPLTAVYESPVNNYSTFYVIPMGSKAGWPESKLHLDRIETIKKIIKEFDYEDGSNPIDFTVSEYGDFEG
jgi:hypothetical protein